MEKAITNQAEALEANQQIPQEIMSFSQEFNDTMADCQKIICKYNQLLKITQHLMYEINHLSTYPQPESESETIKRYYEKMIKGLKICQVFGEAIDQDETLDGMIGYYLLGAKSEANKIIDKANQYLNDAKIKMTLIDIQSLEQQDRLNQELRVSRHHTEINQTGELLVLPAEAEIYATQIIRDADRYSRRRKLIADDHVNSAKREIDDYREKRRQEIQLEEEKLRTLTNELQQKFNKQLDGTLDTIDEFIQGTS